MISETLDVIEAPFSTKAGLAVDGGTPVRTEPFPGWPIVENSDRERLLQALESGVWGINGSLKPEFEEKFAAYVGTRYSATVANGSVSLRLALIAAGIQAGEEVIVPPYTFIATASAVLESNATPIFVDVEPDTYNLDPELIEAAITPRTRAIIPVHLGGLPADMDRINAVAKRHGLTVIEDAAHAHGAEWKGRKVGSLGDMASFSFQSSKNLASGEGGVVTTSDENLIERLRALRSCGRLSGDAWYDHGILGGNYRLSELQAALLLSQFERLDEQAIKRDTNGLYLNEQLAQIEGIEPLKRGGGETRHAYHLYTFKYSPQGFSGWSRERFLEALNAEGIPATSGYYKPIYQQPYFQRGDFAPYQKPDIDYNQVVCPVGEQACREAVWLHQSMLLGEKTDMDDIVEAIAKVQHASR
jgi:dTDP-4-amino-4,6-dideoxygalactose transaminase